jgi:GntR family transcriptional regulator
MESHPDGPARETKETTSTPRYRELADMLREAILSGELQPGATLPKLTELTDRYHVAKATASRAVQQLAAEGLVDAIRKRGTVVRQRPPRRRITRDRTVYRDELGYYFDPVAQPWRALATPTVTRGPVPWDVAHLLGVQPGDEVVIRDRIMGDPDAKQAHQLATSYLPLDLVSELPVLGASNTGPGGIYDRMEEAGHGPLEWNEAISARPPSNSEANLLKLSPGVSLLRILRTASDPAGKVCEVNDTRLNAEQWEIGYSISRDGTDWRLL